MTIGVVKVDDNTEGILQKQIYPKGSLVVMQVKYKKSLINLSNWASFVK